MGSLVSKCEDQIRIENLCFGVDRVLVGGLWSYSVEPFVVGVEFWQHHNEYLHFSDGSMPSTGANHDAHTGMYIDLFVIQLHLGTSFAFQEVVRLGELFVVVQFCIFRDLGDVNGAWKIFHLCESSPRCTAWAGCARDVGEINRLVALLGGFLRHRWDDDWRAGTTNRMLGSF